MSTHLAVGVATHVPNAVWHKATSDINHTGANMTTEWDGVCMHNANALVSLSMSLRSGVWVNLQHARSSKPQFAVAAAS